MLQNFADKQAIISNNSYLEFYEIKELMNLNIYIFKIFLNFKLSDLFPFCDHFGK